MAPALRFSLFAGVLNGLYHVQLLPWHGRVAEVPKGSSAAVNGAPEIKTADDRFRSEVERCLYGFGELPIGNLSCTNVSTITDTGCATPIA